MAAPVTELLARLVAIPTVAGGDNRALIAEVGERLDQTGAAVRVIPGTRPDAQLLHAVLGPADAPGGLLLAAHGDVVGIDGQPWTSDPFALRAAEGRLYGRGTTDMKGFIAAVLAAVASVDASALRAPLHVCLSHDEELGCAGIGPLLHALNGARGLAAPLAGVVVGEPTGLRVVQRHKGKAAFSIVIQGRAAHSATPGAGVNAVRAAAHLIVALEGLERELAAEASDASFTVAHATIGIGPIAGGIAVNIVPDRCTLAVEARVLPGQSLDDVQRRIGELGSALADVGVEVQRVAGYPALAADPGAAAGAFAARVASAAAPAPRGGKSTAMVDQALRVATTAPGDGLGQAVDFGTEAGVYQERLGVPVVVCGPGSMAQGHVADEFIVADELAAGQAFVTRLIEGLGDG